MNQDNLIPKTALISVSDKTGLIAFAKQLQGNNIEIISTGGTHHYLQENGIAAIHVSDITHFPEIMSGRVKTLHPLILGGILGRRSIDDKEANEHHIPWIDLVVCNLYPFEKVIQAEHCQFSDALENIDIGGSTLLRAAAKNFPYTTVVSCSNDYPEIIRQIEISGVSYQTRKELAYKAFSLCSNYDATIAHFFNPSLYPEHINDSYKKIATLRYGENPHQQAAVYQDINKTEGLFCSQQYQGKLLSYNNWVDAQAAIDCIDQLTSSACCIIKHAMPCGVAIAETIHAAFGKAFDADSKSAFGGVIAINRLCDKELAKQISQYFVEIIIAPGFTEDALAVFKTKEMLRVLECSSNLNSVTQIKKYLPGGMLLQDKDNIRLTSQDLKLVTETPASEKQIKELLFAWHCVKYAKSNAIAIVKDHTTIGIAGGQVSRVDAVELAIKKAGMNSTGGVLASDAFFPFKDSIELIAKAKISAIIQPGGSKRDEEVIQACNEYGIAMLFTGMRCFYH